MTMNQVASRYDGRDALFARLDLLPGSRRYDEYYRRHPERKQADDTLRERGGLLRLVVGGSLSVDQLMQLKATQSHAAQVLDMLPDEPLARALMDDSAATIKDLSRADMERPAALRQVKLPPREMTALVKKVSLLYGASAVGIAAMEEGDYYSYRRTGEPVTRRFLYGVVFAVAMDRSGINHAPRRETLLATCNGYVAAAQVGARLSGFMKSLGYETSLNSMANYDVPLVPLAEKAGLGQRGRCHFLITPGFGNRVRLGAVLTDLPLEPDAPADFGFIEFCALCGKCAINCPSHALSGQPEIINERPRWRFDETKCFTMWTKFATDCGLCIKHCPLSQCPDPAKVAAMKDDPELMWEILQQDRAR